MLEPLSALSIACAAVQFVDFGIKLVSEGVELYEKGSLAQNDELELITKELNHLTGSILSATVAAEQSHSGTPRTPISKEEKALMRVAASCNEVGKQLTDLLGSLKAQRSNTRMGQGVESFRAALRDIRKRGDIRDMERRLRGIQTQLSTHLLSLLSDKQSRVLSMLNHISSQNQRSEVAALNKIDKLRKEIIEELRIQNTDRSTYDSWSNLSNKCNHLFEEEQRASAAQRVLRSLDFRSRKTRKSTIKEAHNGTFEWMFEESSDADGPQAHFLTWLKGGNGIFWVSGKAGSGKSTLMKLLVDHMATQAALRFWADEKKLVTASFFFWSAGSSMQKSQQGLLQSFLHQILGQCPDLIEKLHLSCWSTVKIDDDEGPYLWTYQQLVDGLKEVASQDILPANFCFFVDGLDEYEGEDSDIVSILRELSMSSNVKICASSRPWNAFTKAFGSNPKLTLSIQDFTKDDIRLFATETLSQDQSFLTLASKDNDYLNLIEEITGRAQGVFLWVYLVVRSLIRGSVDDNSIRQMQRRLNTFPSDLESYFRQMLDSVEEIYHERAAQTFQLVLYAQPDLTTTEYWFFEKEMDDPSYDHQPIPAYAFSEMVRESVTHVNAYCRDLLEFTTHQKGPSPLHKIYWEYDIVFLHRTVKDFLETNEIQIFLRTRSGPRFDALTALCKMQLASIKAPIQISGPLKNIELEYFLENISKLFKYAYMVEITKGYNQEKLLDECESSITKYLRMSRNEGLRLEIFDDGDLRRIFFSAAIRAGLCLYVRRRLEINHELLQPSRKAESLLRLTYNSGATNELYISAVNPLPWYLSIDMIELFLSRGADPNQRVGECKKTIWHEFVVYSCANGYEKLAHSEVLARAIEGFIRYGADYKSKIEIRWVQRTPMAIFHDLWEPHQYMRIADLVLDKDRQRAVEKEEKAIGFCRCIVL